MLVAFKHFIYKTNTSSISFSLLKVVVMGCQTGGLAYLTVGDDVHLETSVQQYPVYVRHPASYFGLLHIK